MKHLLAYWGLRAGAGLIGLLPWSAVRFLGSVFGSVWARFDRTRTNMAARHLARTSGDGSDAVEVMKSYGRYYLEALWSRPRRIEKMLDATEVRGLDFLLDAKREGKGMVLALPHMGNWEAAAPIAAEVGIDIVAVAEDLPNRRITGWFTRMREGFGIEIVLATGRLEVMRRLEGALEQNKAVALLSDRDLKGKGVTVSMFGENTTLPPGPATLAIRTGAPLFPVGCYFTDDGYDVVVHPRLDIPDNGPKSDRVRQVTQHLAHEFEAIIRAHPTQWHLVVPNWPSDRQ